MKEELRSPSLTNQSPNEHLICHSLMTRDSSKVASNCTKLIKQCFSDKHLLKGSCCVPKSITFLLMRFHIFHEASSDHLLISDSQTHSVRNNTTVALGVVNVLTLPGGQIRHSYYFLPKPSQYKSVTLFIGGNDLRGTYHRWKLSSWR